jgi:beta-glucosidase
LESREGIFPTAFAWGAASSAAQSEGVSEHSDWRLRERSGAAPVSGRGNNKGQCYDEDFLRLADLGLLHFRTSLDWSRFEPQKGVYDREAIENCRRMLETAQRRGLTVWLSLHHVCLPAWFQKLGGFMEETARVYWHRFVEFAAKELGPLAEFWIPIHEPTAYAAGAYLLGRFPPGKQRMDKFNEMLIHVHQAHGEAYRILKTYLPSRAKVGMATLVVPVEPRTETDTDRFGADFVDGLVNRVSLDAIERGAVSVPGRGAVEVPLCKGAADFIGIDYFFRLIVGREAPRADLCFAELGRIEGMPAIRTGREGEARSEECYGIHALGLYAAIKRVNQAELGLPLYVTGAGVATGDEDLRVRYLAETVAALERALVQGLDVRGCLLTSDVDGYEWNRGYNAHYGLFGFDPQSFERRARPAAGLVARVTHERRLPKEHEPPPVPPPASEVPVKG